MVICCGLHTSSVQLLHGSGKSHWFRICSTWSLLSSRYCRCDHSWSSIKLKFCNWSRRDLMTFKGRLRYFRMFGYHKQIASAQVSLFHWAFRQRGRDAVARTVVSYGLRMVDPNVLKAVGYDRSLQWDLQQALVWMICYRPTQSNWWYSAAYIVAICAFWQFYKRILKK